MVQLEIPDNGRLSDNIAHFARALRKTGLRVGPGRVIEAIRAVQVAGFTSRNDFYWALHAVFVSRPEERQVFAQVFRLFWRDPRYLEHMMAAMLPAIRGVQEERPAEAAAKRAAEAMLDGAILSKGIDNTEESQAQIEIDASQTTSSEERLRTLDFEQMSPTEMAEAKRILASLRLPIRPLVSRRTVAALGRLPDWRGTMRQAMKNGGEVFHFSTRKRRDKWPNLIALCDISGSMSSYSRAVLHFLHAVMNDTGADWAKVHAFTFGTRLTNITRLLMARDVDDALKAAGSEAQDWEGGTRIGACLKAFNRDWSRRVMGQGAVVLLISDGLDRDDTDILAREMERLHLSSRKVIWVNPLLRWDGFAPKARGIRTMLAHVDCFRPGHNIASLEGLAKVLSHPMDMGEKVRIQSMLRET